MHVTISSSPTGDLDAATIARFRRHDSWLDYDRHQAGLSDLLECDCCKAGIAQRVAVDYDPDFGASYEAVAGSSRDGSAWFCPACTSLVAA